MKDGTYPRSGPTYTIEADRRSSNHVGMVFGRFVNDADERRPRIVGWWVLRDGRPILKTRTRQEALRAIERRTHDQAAATDALVARSDADALEAFRRVLEAGPSDA